MMTDEEVVQLVLDKYREKGIRAAYGRFGIREVGGKICAWGDGCCPTAVLVLGEPAAASTSDLSFHAIEQFHARTGRLFYWNIFDGIATETVSYGQHSPHREDSLELKVYLALREAGLI